MTKVSLSFNNSKKTSLTCKLFGIVNLERCLFDFSSIESIEKLYGITLISGISGVGKTIIGKYLKNKFEYVDIDNEKFDKNIPIIDVIDRDFEKSIYYLNLCGLSEPYLYLTTFNNLSTGQKFRFKFALIISRGVKNIYCDEFCSTLDRDTSYFLSFNISRVSAKEGVNFILISNDICIKDYLFPNQHILLDLHSNVIVSNYNYNSSRVQNPFLKNLKILKASYEDYLLLEKYHYFPSCSKEVADLYQQVYYKLIYNDLIVGVIAYRNPYSKEEEEDSLVYINKNLSVIYRIILHPLVRGCGISKIFINRTLRLINKKYFYVESALANYIPFFERLNWNTIQDFKYDTTRGYLKMIDDDFRNIDDVLDLLSKVIYFKYKVYCYILSIKKTLKRRDILFSLKNLYTIKDLNILREFVIYFKMKRYFYEKK
ncbi:ABC transporter [Avibacterium sp. 20-15]|uniref:ABC transporter n=1 Tax=unclassified Avibacterium TaxID=2685287 RepID=UPI002025E833|nr:MULTISPECIES: ABC transporter [unclassified Avibacterium]MCW9732900.1 ABC transporter [Avibacterium sp. 20-15]URL05035.1 ABC transporter [Avibacterium sp. 20-132]